MVSDDIVTRLHKIASLQGDISGRTIPVACMDAADEIHRLRDEIHRLRDAMRLMYAYYHADNGAELVATYEKAVRGE